MSKKQLPTGVRVLLGFLSFLLCIVLFVSSLLTILVADLSLLTSKGGLQKLVQDILFSTSAPARPGFAPAGVFTGRSPIRLEEGSGLPAIPSDILDSITGGAMDGNLQDVLTDAFFEIFKGDAEEIPFTKEEVSEFIDKSTLPEFISDKVSGIVVDVINGEITTTITKEDVENLIEENKTLIEDTFQVEVPEEVIESVGTFVEESKLSESIQQGVSDIVGVTPPAQAPNAPAASENGGSSGEAAKPGKPIFRPSDLEVLDKVVSGEAELQIAEILALVRIITAPAVLIACIAFCLVISGLLFLTNWGRPNAALRCSGIPYLLAGLLFLIPSAIAQFVPALFAEMGIAGTAIRQILALAGTVSLGVALFGLALIIGGAVWGSQLKKKAIAEAAQTASVTAAVEVDLVQQLLNADEPVAQSAPETAPETAPEETGI